MYLDNGSMAYAASQKSDSYDKRDKDLYQTDPVAVHALVNYVSLPSKIWEPCAGKRAIVRVLMNRGFTVYGSDICDYGDPRVQQKDFFSFTEAPKGYNTIVTNPPYMKAIPAKLVNHALTLVPKVFLLLRLPFLEGCSEARCLALDSGHLKTIYVFKERLPRMHREGWTGGKATNTTAFMWAEWDREFYGDAIFKRISIRT